MLSVTANLFDMNLKEDFNELTISKLQQKQLSVMHTEQDLRENPMRYENRYTLKPISEADEKSKHHAHHTLNTDEDGFYSETAGDLSLTQREYPSTPQDEDMPGDVKLITGAFKLGKVPD